jgi:ribose-phosphate pyrophosphokinase
MKIFAGSASGALAQDVAAYLNVTLGKSETRRFSDGELGVKYNENIRGTDVFIVQSTQPPAEHVLELLIMIDAARRASARRVTAVIPYYGYARQDRKDQPRVSITAKLLANLITTAGAHRVLTMDLHSAQIQGFFDIPFDHLYASFLYSEHIKSMNLSNLIVVAPDVGSVKLARAYAKRLDTSLAILDKRRPKPNVSEVVNIIGDVSGKNVLMVDDLIDTGGTLFKASEVLKKKGAQDIFAYATHGLLSKDAVSRLNESHINKLVISDTVALPPEKCSPKIEVVSVSHIIGEAIRRIHSETSISSLFDWQMVGTYT